MHIYSFGYLLPNDHLGNVPTCVPELHCSSWRSSYTYFTLHSILLLSVKGSPNFRLDSLLRMHTVNVLEKMLENVQVWVLQTTVFHKKEATYEWGHRTCTIHCAYSTSGGTIAEQDELFITCNGLLSVCRIRIVLGTSAWLCPWIHRQDSRCNPMKASTSRWDLVKSILSFQESLKQRYRLVFLFNFLIYHLNTFKDEQATESRFLERKASKLCNTGDRIYLKLWAQPTDCSQTTAGKKGHWQAILETKCLPSPDLKLVDKKISAFADSETPRLILEAIAGNSRAES